jgi:hypothetical protein
VGYSRKKEVGRARRARVWSMSLLSSQFMLSGSRRIGG